MNSPVSGLRKYTILSVVLSVFFYLLVFPILLNTIFPLFLLALILAFILNNYYRYYVSTRARSWLFSVGTSIFSFGVSLLLFFGFIMLSVVSCSGGLECIGAGTGGLFLGILVIPFSIAILTWYYYTYF